MNGSSNESIEDSIKTFGLVYVALMNTTNKEIVTELKAKEYKAARIDLILANFKRINEVIDLKFKMPDKILESILVLYYKGLLLSNSLQSDDKQAREQGHFKAFKADFILLLYNMMTFRVEKDLIEGRKDLTMKILHELVKSLKETNARESSKEANHVFCVIIRLLSFSSNRLIYESSPKVVSTMVNYITSGDIVRDFHDRRSFYSLVDFIRGLVFKSYGELKEFGSVEDLAGNTAMLLRFCYAIASFWFHQSSLKKESLKEHDSFILLDFLESYLEQLTRNRDLLTGVTQQGNERTEESIDLKPSVNSILNFVTYLYFNTITKNSHILDDKVTSILIKTDLLHKPTEPSTTTPPLLEETQASLTSQLRQCLKREEYHKVPQSLKPLQILLTAGNSQVRRPDICEILDIILEQVLVPKEVLILESINEYEFSTKVKSEDSLQVLSLLNEELFKIFEKQVLKLWSEIDMATVRDFVRSLSSLDFNCYFVYTMENLIFELEEELDSETIDTLNVLDTKACRAVRLLLLYYFRFVGRPCDQDLDREFQFSIYFKEGVNLLEIADLLSSLKQGYRRYKHIFLFLKDFFDSKIFNSEVYSSKKSAPWDESKDMIRKGTIFYTSRLDTKLQSKVKSLKTLSNSLLMTYTNDIVSKYTSFSKGFLQRLKETGTNLSRLPIQDLNYFIMYSLKYFSKSERLIKYPSLIFLNSLTQAQTGSQAGLDISKVALLNLDMILNEIMNSFVIYTTGFSDHEIGSNELNLEKIDILKGLIHVASLNEETRNSFASQLTTKFPFVFKILDLKIFEKDFKMLISLLDIFGLISEFFQTVFTRVSLEIAKDSIETRDKALSAILFDLPSSSKDRIRNYLKANLDITNANSFRQLILRLVPLLTVNQLIYKVLLVYRNLLCVLYLLPLDREEAINFSTEDSINTVIPSALGAVYCETRRHLSYIVKECSNLRLLEFAFEFLLEFSHFARDYFYLSRLIELLEDFEPNFRAALRDFGYGSCDRVVDALVAFFRFCLVGNAINTRTISHRRELGKSGMEDSYRIVLEKQCEVVSDLILLLEYYAKLIRESSACVEGESKVLSLIELCK